MKQRYVIKGTGRIGDKVRLFLVYDDLVKEKDENEMGMMASLGMLKNLNVIQEEMQQKAILMSQPDTITISYEEWERYKYKIDDVIYVEVISDEKMEQ